MDKIEFSLENGEKTEFYVLEQTRLGGCDYILVTDTVDEEEGEALILKDIPLLKIKMPSMKSWMTNANWMRWQKFFPICWMISTWKIIRVFVQSGDFTSGKLSCRPQFFGRR